MERTVSHGNTIRTLFLAFCSLDTLFGFFTHSLWQFVDGLLWTRMGRIPVMVSESKEIAKVSMSELILQLSNIISNNQLNPR